MPVFITSAVLLFSAFPAFAETQHQRLVYEVYAGGIHAVQAELNVGYSGNDRYDINLAAKTRGFLAKLAPWQGTFESNGWVNDDGSLQPELHKSTATWRDESEVKEYNYSRSGTFESLVITEHDKAPERPELEAALTQGTIDALTATLLVMEKTGEGGKCEGTSEVFDGKRRFEMVFVPQEQELLQPTRYNVYEGNTQICTVEVKPVAGQWYDKPRGWLSIQEQGRERGTMPTIWMGKIAEDGPAVPVKILVKTAYGALFAHLAEYESEEQLFIAENRSEAEAGE